MYRLIATICLALGLAACGSTVSETNSVTANYLDNSMRDDRLSGGVKMIPIKTVKGTFNVWTKRVGNNPTMKVLLLHGGPGMTHEYFEAFDSYFPSASIEYYYYDQLGSYYSDDPADPSLVNIEHYVDEVEQVRTALGLNKDNFYVLGHSWGGILAIEYALKYQQNLKGMIISNMVASIPEYNKYANNVLMSTMDPEVLQQIKDMEAAKDYTNPKYMELLIPHHYEHHVLRMPSETWPDPVNRAFEHANPDVYVPMQGPSELGASGKLLLWDQTANLPKITVPTLSIGAQHDTMDPKAMEALANQVQNGRYLHCPNGSHMAMYDDQEIYFEGVIKFIKDVDQKQF
ncbi:proline iminopeptidase-family hydrolase [uncultured Paraglaciecola sp.]|uniref:proline iminopeptidase-family hydrolase n=1 Tax=uncultured Paraglaciecola sp. TaxID=1765024 RepID=UPI00262FB01D|nr:proline iminopeptidase-family hydrolase [uncultured Paraglaciecola sp.]